MSVPSWFEEMCKPEHEASAAIFSIGTVFNEPNPSIDQLWEICDNWCDDLESVRQSALTNMFDRLGVANLVDLMLLAAWLEDRYGGQMHYGTFLMCVFAMWRRNES
jgi:hypothetical protein